MVCSDRVFEVVGGALGVWCRNISLVSRPIFFFIWAEMKSRPRFEVVTWIGHLEVATRNGRRDLVELATGGLDHCRLGPSEVATPF